MNLSVQVFWLPKGGHSEEDYEDSFAFSIQKRRFAIADGATETSFAKQWAQSLVQAFVSNPPPFPFPEPCWRECFEGWLRPIQQSWQEGIDWENLTWFAAEKARMGASSSLLGVIFEEVSPNILRWSSLAFGDSCLFQIRGDKLLVAFPIDKAEKFNDRPLLLSSYPHNNERVWKEVQVKEGDCQPKDIFLLMTDALALWFLIQWEEGEKSWEEICNLRDQKDFTLFVSRLRHERRIKNDDVTLLIIRVSHGRKGRTKEVRGSELADSFRLSRRHSEPPYLLSRP